jgi:hypothetical protein
MAKDPNDRYPSAGDLGRAALAASQGSTLATRERTVAKGEAAPTRIASDRVRRPHRRRLIWAGAVLAALAAAVVLALVLPGGSGSDGVSTLSLTPIAAQQVPAIPKRRPLQTVSVSAPAGYQYRVSLDTVDAPKGASPRAQLPLYLTLMAKRGATPFVTVQQLKLPPAWRWTASSILASFTLDPEPDGSGQLALSWFVVSGDHNDVTHYIGVGPQGFALQS